MSGLSHVAERVADALASQAVAVLVQMLVQWAGSLGGG